MKPDYFGQLDELDQAELIWETGVLIGKRKNGFNNLLLFQIDAFYAEIHYHAHFNVIIRIKTFTDTNILDPYLQQISLENLFD